MLHSVSGGRGNAIRVHVSLMVRVHELVLCVYVCVCGGGGDVCTHVCM